MHRLCDLRVDACFCHTNVACPPFSAIPRKKCPNLQDLNIDEGLRVPSSWRACGFPGIAPHKPVELREAAFSTLCPECNPSSKTSCVKVEDDGGREKNVHEQVGNCGQGILLRRELLGKTGHDKATQDTLNDTDGHGDERDTTALIAHEAWD